MPEENSTPNTTSANNAGDTLNTPNVPDTPAAEPAPTTPAAEPTQSDQTAQITPNIPTDPTPAIPTIGAPTPTPDDTPAPMSSPIMKSKVHKPKNKLLPVVLILAILTLAGIGVSIFAFAQISDKDTEIARLRSELANQGITIPTTPRRRQQPFRRPARHHPRHPRRSPLCRPWRPRPFRSQKPQHLLQHALQYQQ